MSKQKKEPGSVYKFRIELEGTVAGTQEEAQVQADKALEKVLSSMLRGKMRWNTDYQGDNIIEESFVSKLSAPKIARRFIRLISKEGRVRVTTKLEEVE